MGVYLKVMPIYEFYCRQCKKRFEEEMGMAEVGKKKVRCPQCGKEAERVYGFNVGGENKGESGPAPSCPTGTCPFAR